MKKILLLFLLFCTTTTLLAQTFTAGGINYNVTSATTVEVGLNPTASGAIVIPATVTNAAINYSVTSIGNDAFRDCTFLTLATIPNSVILIGDRAFLDCSGLTSLTLPNSVISIGSQAFFYCTGLSSVTIPNSVTTINDQVFNGCSAITSLNISNSVTSIGYRAFRFCTSLTSLNIPSSVATLTNYAFENCTGLTSVTVNWATPLVIDANVFLNVNLSNKTLNVPAGTAALYDAAAVWTDFNPIVAAPAPATHLNFDGTNDAVTLPVNVGNALSNGTEITVEYWYKGTNLQSGVRFQNGTDWIVAGWAGLNTTPSFIISTDGGLNGVSSGPVATIQDNTWHHLAFVWKKNEIFATYLDGVLQNSRVAANVNLPPFNGINGAIGVWLAGNQEYLNGNIDDVRIWNVARSANDIARAKNCELAGNEAGLLAYYKFNQGTDQGTNTAITSLLDATTNANHGTLNSGFAKTGTTSNFLAGSVVTKGSTIPAAPTASAQSFCTAATASNLLPAISATLKWYASATSTTALVATDVLATGTYYVAAVNANGCESARTALVVTINTIPAPTSAVSPNTSLMVNLTGNCALVLSGSYIESGIYNGKKFYNLENANPIRQIAFNGVKWIMFISGDLSRVVFENNTVLFGLYPPISGWEIVNSGECGPTGTMTITVPPATATFCSGATVANLTATGTDLKWYSTETGGTALATTTALATGTYYVSQTLNGCESARTALAVTIDTIAAPTASAQTFTTASTVANLVPAPSTTIKWYDAPTGGTALATTTAIATGNYYAAATNINGCESARTTVAVTVNLVVLPFIGQTFTAGGINYIVTKATLPYEVAVHRHTAFTGAANIPASVTNTGFAFSVTRIGNDAFYQNSGLTAVTIPTSITSFGTNAFRESGLVSVVIPNSITTIPFGVFHSCTSLTSVTIPNSVTTILESAFEATGLTTVTIPSTVSTIDRYVFYGCTSLTSFTVNWLTPIVNSPTVFENVMLANVTLNVPAGTRALYQAAAVWQNFNPIVEMADPNSTIWNGSAWSNGTPDASKNAIFTGNYTSSGNLTALSVEVQNTAVVIVPSGSNLTVTNDVTVASTASLVFENNANLMQTTNANNTGNIVYKRNTTIKRLDYTYWSSPVAGQKLLDFTPNTLPNRFYTFDEPTNKFVQVAEAATTNFEAARGYSLRAPNTQSASPSIFNGVFTGVPNNGVFTIPVTVTSGQGAGYNLLGNPYPSTMNGNRFLQDNTGSMYFWTHQSSYSGTTIVNGGAANYASFNLSGGVAATVSGGVNVTPNGFIQAGQGFMFLTTVSKNVTFTNTMREGNNADQFFRTANQTENNKLWLNLTNNEGTFSQTMIAYLPNTTTGYDDGYDAKQINIIGNVLSSQIGTENYAIQSRGNFDNADVVKLNLNIATAGSYTLSKDNTNGIFSNNQDFFLKDNLTGLTHNIKQTPYTFVTDAGANANRFSVVYQNATLSNNTNVFEKANVIVFEQNGTLNISATEELQNVKVYDIQGRNIFEVNDINSKTITLNNFSAKQQVFLIQITNANNEVVTKKVIF